MLLLASLSLAALLHEAEAFVPAPTEPKKLLHVISYADAMVEVVERRAEEEEALARQRLLQQQQSSSSSGFGVYALAVGDTCSGDGSDGIDYGCEPGSSACWENCRSGVCMGWLCKPCTYNWDLCTSEQLLDKSFANPEDCCFSDDSLHPPTQAPTLSPTETGAPSTSPTRWPTYETKAPIPGMTDQPTRAPTGPTARPRRRGAADRRRARRRLGPIRRRRPARPVG